MGGRQEGWIALWEGVDDAPRTILSFDLAPHDDGTEVRLTHERLASAESRDMHEQGWTSALERRVALLD